MSTKKPTAPGSETAASGGRGLLPETGLGRRRFLQAAVGFACGGSLLRPGVASAAPSGGLAEGRLAEGGLAELLEQSPFVYVSPLLRDGSESRCHGEVWYGWLEGDVVLVTDRSTWKGRALARGLARARIWVGDHGVWKRWWGRDESFRDAPSFIATAKAVRDDALMERLMTLFAEKYPSEFADWEPRMRSGYASGERLLIRYSGSF